MTCNKFDASNRTSINVSKKFRNKIQKLSCMYTLKYGKHISVGDLLELITDSVCKNTELALFIRESLDSVAE